MNLLDCKSHVWNLEALDANIVADFRIDPLRTIHDDDLLGTNDKITSIEYLKLTNAPWSITGSPINKVNTTHNICQVNSLICTGANESDNDGITCHIIHDRATSKAIGIQNQSGDNLYLGYGRRDDSTNRSQLAGLILENEDGNKFWLFLNPTQDKQHGGSGFTTWTVDDNISFDIKRCISFLESRRST